MIRGTTPTLTFNLGVKISDLSDIYITFSQNGKTVLERKDGQPEGKHSVKIELTQEETLAFEVDPVLLVQVRAKSKQGDALASNIMRINVEDVLKEGKI